MDRSTSVLGDSFEWVMVVLYLWMAWQVTGGGGVKLPMSVEERPLMRLPTPINNLMEEPRGIEIHSFLSYRSFHKFSTQRICL